MKVIFGLGNPGLKFRNSRHNLGFLVVEKLAKIKRIKLTKKAFNCLVGEGRIESENLLLVKPLTFVNLSGQAVATIVKRKNIRLKDLLIVCDDVNLPLGKIRLRPKGSDGGHKGLRSIIEALETGVFPRLRIGVSIPQEKERCSSGRRGGKLSTYVLGNFNKKERKIIHQALDTAAGACGVWAREGITSAMNRFNRKGD